MKADKYKLKQHVQLLTQTPRPRNFMNMDQLDDAADYIAMNMKKYSTTVGEQPFDVKNRIYKNIIASYGQAESRRIVVGAHYDVCGDTPGADDNASAVAVLLELFRMINMDKPKLDCLIEFVAYSLEEPPFFATENMGSAVHAASLKKKDVEVKVMICLEMLGYFTDEANSQRYPLPELSATYPSVGNFIALLTIDAYRSLAQDMEAVMAAATDLQVVNLVSDKSFTGIDFSDHRNYWRRDMPAVMVTDTAFYRNNNYHGQADTYDTLNYEKMALVANGLYQAIKKLGQGY